MKKPVCNFNCFECPHPDCICDDFSRKEYVTDAEINRIAGMTRSKTGLRKKRIPQKVLFRTQRICQSIPEKLLREKQREDSRKGEGALPKEQRQIHSKRACLSREQ